MTSTVADKRIAICYNRSYTFLDPALSASKGYVPTPVPIPLGSESRIGLEFRVKLIAPDNGMQVNGHDGNGGNGAEPLKIQSPFYTGDIDPNLVQKYAGKGLEYLFSYHDFKGKAPYNFMNVQKTAAEIRDKLSPERRENPYYLIAGTLNWINEKIRGSLVSPHTLEHVTNAIERLPESQRHDLSAILNKSYLVLWSRVARGEVKLGPIANYFNLPKEIEEPSELAKILMMKIQQQFQQFPELLPRDSKGITNIYVDLAQSLGIGTVPLHGIYLRNENYMPFSWAASHIPPFGLVQVNPTLMMFSTGFGGVQPFDHEVHWYRFRVIGTNDNGGSDARIELNGTPEILDSAHKPSEMPRNGKDNAPKNGSAATNGKKQLVEV